MKTRLTAALAGLAMLAGAGAAHADGELNLFNWGNYTSPELLK
jgi:spermidine/putrescine transport system substrate-binding protein